MSVRIKQLRAQSEAWTAATIGNHAFDPTRQPKLKIATKKVRRFVAAVSPDCSYRLVKQVMTTARHEICLYIYNASADYLLTLLSDAKQRGVRVRVMYDINDTRGDEKTRLEGLGVELKQAPSTGTRRVFTVCHQKFAVVDGSILLIGSANWATSSIPKVEVGGAFKKGNREWLVRLDEPSIAGWFHGLFDADWDIPEAPGPPREMEMEIQSKPVLFARQVPTGPERRFDLKQVTLKKGAKVTPVISPDNYSRLIKRLIKTAKRSIYVEQQYILAGGPATEGILDALHVRKDELDIRIIVSPAFREIGDKDNWELTMDSLEANALKDRLRGMNLRFYTHLHNKGLILDEKRVIVSSTNWSENSITRAREAGVLIECEEVASYFTQVFEYDWSIALPISELPANLAWSPQAGLRLQEGAIPIHPADLV